MTILSKILYLSSAKTSNMNKQFLILCAVLVPAKAIQNQTVCYTATQDTQLHTIKWPTTKTGESTTSIPFCVNKRKELVHRKCTEGIWDDEPECYNIQEVYPFNSPQCPEGFKDYEDFCYTFSEKSKFPPKCPFKDVLPFSDSKGLIRNEIPVWMPLKRNRSSGLGPLLWLEASGLYKTTIEEKEDEFNIVESTNINNDCLLYYNSSYIIQVSCEEEHSGLCVYPKFNKIVLDHQICKEPCFRNDYSSSSSCVCLGIDATYTSAFDLAVFPQPYQNQVYKAITNSDCHIGLEKTENGSYVWTDTYDEIKYTYWSVYAIFDSGYRYGAITQNGWILTQKQLSCFLYEYNEVIPEPKLELIFNKANNLFYLKITHPRGLKKFTYNILSFCFTNAKASYLVYRYPSLKYINATTYSFSPSEDGPGHYWCESLRYIDLEVITSNTVFLRQSDIFQHEFIAVIENLVYVPRSVVGQEFISGLYEIINQLVTPRNYTTRLMKVLDFENVENGTLKLKANVHFTSKNGSILDSITEEFEYIKNIFRLLFDRSFTLKSEYCLEEQAFLNWPATPYGKTANSEEFCITTSGVLVTRQCTGNFMDGAQWKTEDKNCEIFEKSSVSLDLLTLLQSEQLNILGNLSLITNKYENFNALDLYFVAKIVTKLINQDTNLFHLNEVINNLLEIDKRIIISSQNKFLAVKEILYDLDKILMEHARFINVSISTYYIKHNFNFFFIITAAQEVKGIIVNKPKQNLPIIFNISDVNKIGNSYNNLMDSAICLSPQLANEVDSNTPLIFKVFFKDSFFIEESSSTKRQGPVFGLTILGSKKIINNPVWILRKKDFQSTHSCSIWEHGSEKFGFWKNASDASELASYQICEIRSFSFYFSFAYENKIVNSDITDSLLAILQDDLDTSETVEELRNISIKYEEFQHVDIYLTAKILEKVHKDQLHLESLAEVINNIQLINRNILIESQLEQQATDLILHYLDKILVNQNYLKPVSIMNDNFMIFICEFKNINFSGLALLSNNGSFSSKILEGDINVEEVASYINLDSAVILSPELKNQVKKDSKIIVTVFFTDALFNEKKHPHKDVHHKRPSQQHISKIFGVVLPEIGKYKGPLTVLYKIPKEDFQDNCSYWNYNQNISGSWTKDEDGKRLSSTLRCDFWHTTYFAVLLLDHDSNSHSKFLSLVTTITCSISLLSFFIIILTALLFKRWRRHAGNQILVNFTIVGIFQIIFFYVSTRESHKNELQCIVIGAVMHYTVLSNFCWMLVAALLQFKRFVDVLKGPPKNIILKACLCGWILPLVPVIILLASHPKSYVNAKTGICYPSGLGLYLAIWLPVAVIVLFNLAIFVRIIHSVIQSETEYTNIKEKLMKWRLAILLFFMLGLTWIFGFLSELDDVGIVFKYLFCISATLQGFILFLFFIAFNNNTRFMYLQAFKMYCGKNF